MGKESAERNLSAKQVRILKILFKFRFATSSLVAAYRGVNKNSLNRMLQNLVDQKYITKQYNNSFRIDRKGARFSLAPKAITWLKKNSDLNSKTLHSLYNNHRVEESFILLSLDIMQAAICLRAAYPDIFYIYSASEIAGDTDFPKPRPHLYLRRIEEDATKTHEYFMELCHTKLPFMTKKRFKEFVQHYDEEDWPDGTYPTLLFILNTPRQEKAFAQYALEVLDSAGITELQVLTTTYEVLTALPYQPRIWMNITEPRKLVTL